jgi:hypothetical protein
VSDDAAAAAGNGVHASPPGPERLEGHTATAAAESRAEGRAAPAPATVTQTTCRLSAEDKRELRDQAQRLLERLKNLHEGAFAPWTEDPIFRATALPLLGFASVQAVNWITTLLAR